MITCHFARLRLANDCTLHRLLHASRLLLPLKVNNKFTLDTGWLGYNDRVNRDENFLGGVTPAATAFVCEKWYRNSFSFLLSFFLSSSRHHTSIHAAGLRVNNVIC